MGQSRISIIKKNDHTPETDDSMRSFGRRFRSPKWPGRRPAPPPLFRCELGEVLTLSELEEIEGVLCRDGSASHPSTPKVGEKHKYLCIGILNVSTKKVFCQNHETHHEKRLMELSESYDVVFQKPASNVYMLARDDDKFPIFVNDQNIVAHYLRNNWSAELYSCYSLKKKSPDLEETKVSSD